MGRLVLFPDPSWIRLNFLERGLGMRLGVAMAALVAPMAPALDYVTRRSTANWTFTSVTSVSGERTFAKIFRSISPSCGIERRKIIYAYSIRL